MRQIRVPMVDVHTRSQLVKNAIEWHSSDWLSPRLRTDAGGTFGLNLQS
jgi:hypothetical protein